MKSEYLALQAGACCLMHFARLANTLLEDEESARDNHVLAYNFAKDSLFLQLRHDGCYPESSGSMQQPAND